VPSPHPFFKLGLKNFRRTPGYFLFLPCRFYPGGNFPPHPPPCVRPHAFFLILNFSLNSSEKNLRRSFFDEVTTPPLILCHPPPTPTPQKISLEESPFSFLLPCHSSPISYTLCFPLLVPVAAMSCARVGGNFSLS